CTRLEIEAVRGVDAEAVLTTLIERRLVRIVGRKEAPGRPLLYATTREFLEVFGLPDLNALPPLRDLGDGAALLAATEVKVAPEGRPTVAALVAGAGRLFPVGRLDLNSTGLLLLTNDGALAAGLLHPRRAVPRVYRVKVDGTPSEEAITRLRRGVRLEDGKSAPARVRVLGRLPTKTWLELTVGEGRTPLVRRPCEA